MLIDATHKRWIIGCVMLGVVASALYWVYAASSLKGPRGGSWPGLVYGSVGSAFMLYAGLFSARKKVPTWRLGRAQTWMKGHLWLGLLSLPMIFFHSGFGFGQGTLTRVLMWLFMIVIVSGIVGVGLQQFLPRIMLQLVPMETIYEQIPSVVAQLRVEADQMIAAACGSFPGQLESPSRSMAPGTERHYQSSKKRGPLVAQAVAEGGEALKDFYLVQVRPYLFDHHDHGSLADPIKRGPAFDQLRTMVPSALHERVADLETICEERRQLELQSRLHHWLHGWLIIHVPLSFAVLLLGAVHAVMAVRY